MRTAGREGAGWARLALLALAAGAVVPLVAAGPRGVLRALLGLAGLAPAAVGLWWTLAHSGAVRTVGAV
ncbi:diacylglycerol kinase, partial [Streptomyces heliomycini]